MTLFAATAEAASNGSLQDYLSLANVPIYVSLVIALLKGWIVTGREYDRVVKDRDDERAERIALQKTLTDTVLPTNQDVQTTLRQVTDMWMSDLLAQRGQAPNQSLFRRPGGGS